jgi:predicted RND superfamily exporter protein
MMRSYTIALLIITPFMVLVIGSLRRSFLCMVPNLLPIYLTLGCMGLVGISLDLSSLMVGCIIIGLAVDDTIHFMHGFSRYYRQTGDVDDAVRQTLETTGMAMLFTSLVLSAGFLCNLASYMKSGADFGVIAAFATMTAFLADVLVMPALLKVTERPSS